MPALPLEAAAVLVLVASMRRAFFGPAPERSDPLAAAAWMVAGLLLLATVLLSRDDALWRLALTGAAVECVCVAAWWLRGPAQDGGDEPAGEPIAPPPDWEEFDRLRGGWDAPVGTR
jgi:hypothetical protein